MQRGADADGKAKAHEDARRATVRLLAPLAADLREWRMASGRPGDGALVFPGREGDLRHSFASLLLEEGRRVHYVAAQLCHSPALTLSTYGHLIVEYADAGSIDAEQEIAKAREGGHPLAGGDRTLEVVARIS